MSNEQISSMAMQSGLGWPQQADGPVAPQAGTPASSWSGAPTAPQAPAPAQFAPPVGAPVNVAPAGQQSPYAPGHSGVMAAGAAPAYGTPAGYPQQGAPAQPMPSYGQPSAYQAQPAPVAPQYGMNQQAAYACQPTQPSTDQLRQLAFSRLKSKATVITVLSFLWCCTTPVILLLVNVIFAQRLCTHAKEIDSPADVMGKVKTARAFAIGLFLLQTSLIILFVISENVR